MSLNLTNPVTTDGVLKLTQTEFDYIESFITAHDRGGYYMALYNMTGSQEALLQAEISMFSEGAGGKQGVTVSKGSSLEFCKILFVL